MKRLACAAFGLLLAFSAGARIVAREQRALTAAEMQSLKSALSPLVQSGQVDLASLKTEASRVLGAPADAWQLQATVWGTSSVTDAGLCTARQLAFVGSHGGHWAPNVAATDARYLWRGEAPVCKRAPELVFVTDGFDDAHAAAIVRGDNHLHDRLVALAVAVCGHAPETWQLAEIGKPDLADFEDKRRDTFPHVGVVMTVPSGFPSLHISVRFGPNGPEPWNHGRCEVPVS